MTQGPANAQDALLHTFAHVSFQTWREQVERALKGADFDRRLVTRTLEGIAVQPLYTADSVPTPAAGDLPGSAPYRRGSQATGRHGEQWDMRARYDHPASDVLRRELEADLARGARSLWLRFDASVRLGRAPLQPPRLRDERGVPCVNLEQLAAMLQDVPLSGVTISLDAGANALPVAALFIAAAQQRGVALEQLCAWFNADPLAALARDGQLPGGLQAARAQLTELARFSQQRAPRARSVTVSSVHYHDAGAHAAQEIGLSLATGVTYLRWLTAAGLELRAACDQIAFSMAVGTDYFLEIAKLRALRQCWARVVAACGGDEDAQRSVLHATSSDRSKTARDPWVNLLRETTEAFAAAVGGADCITTAGFDRTIGPSDAFARRISGNVQVILDEEAHVAQVADPAGGAYYIETLTEQLAHKAWEQLQAIEAQGGMEAALQSGAIGRELGATADARDKLVQTRKQAITGVSEFADLQEQRPLRPEPDWDAIDAARKQLLAAAKPAAATAQLAAGAKQGSRVELAIEAARQGATLEALSAALWTGAPAAQIEPLARRAPAASFERLRDASDAATQARGKRPAVFLCNLGTIPEHKARAQFASNLFQAGGLLVLDNDGFASAQAAADAFAASGAELCAICGSDEAYPRFVEALAPLLRERGAKAIVLAGRFGSAEQSYRAAGVTTSIYAGCNAIETLSGLLASAGVTP